MSEHTIFVNRILSDEPVTASDAENLQGHLAGCPECRQIAESWAAVESVIRSSPILAPRAGFSQRWKALAASRTHASPGRPAWMAFAATSIGVSALGGALIALPLIQNPALVQSAADKAGLFLQSMASSADPVHALNLISSTLTSSTPDPVWIGGAVTMLVLCGLWVTLLIRIISRDRH